MKHAFLAALLTAAMTAAAQDAPVILDLTKAETPMEFDADNGAWTGTYDDEEYTIDSQLFCFLHFSMADYNTWWGFTASNSADSSLRDNFVTYQFSNMARGGIVLNEDGTVKTDERGTPVVSPDVPYMLAFANSFFSEHPAELVMSDGLDHQAVGVYVGLNSYTYYAVAEGDSFARQFGQGDSLILTIHGIDSEDNESSLNVSLASYDNGDLTAARGWKYVDLTPLGKVNQIWFSMKSTDSGAYGDNTPCYFCLDKLSVMPADIDTGVETAVSRPHTSIAYDRASGLVSLGGANFAMVYDVAGGHVMSADSAEFSVDALPHGVYVVKAGDASRKIVK